MLFSQIYWISSDNAYLVSHILQFSCLLSFIVYQWISDLGSIFLSPESQFHRSRRWSPFFAISLKMSAIAGAKPMARFLCFVCTFFVPHSTCVERLANHLRTFLLTHRNSKKIRHYKPICVSFDPSDFPLKPIHLRQHLLSFYKSLRHHTEDQMTHNLGFRTMRCRRNAQTGIRSGQ